MSYFGRLGSKCKPEPVLQNLFSVSENLGDCMNEAPPAPSKAMNSRFELNGRCDFPNSYSLQLGNSFRARFLRAQDEAYNRWLVDLNQLHLAYR